MLTNLRNSVGGRPWTGLDCTSAGERDSCQILQARIYIFGSRMNRLHSYVNIEASLRAVRGIVRRRTRIFADRGNIAFDIKSPIIILPAG
jgi:hypothetical protein